MRFSTTFKNSSLTNQTRVWSALFLAFFASAALVLICCGKASKTASPGGSAVEGLPADWDGQSDYELGGWRFEAP
jgi:hypothetical protein